MVLSQIRNPSRNRLIWAGNPQIAAKCTVSSEFETIAKKAGLTVRVNETSTSLRHTLRVRDRSNVGVLFLLVGGVFFVAAPLFATSNTVSIIIGTVFGLSLVTISVLTLIRQAADGLYIKAGTLSFRYNLRQKTLRVDRGTSVAMKVNCLRIQRIGTLGSTMIVTTLHLNDHGNETPIFTFCMAKADAADATKLGNEITRLIATACQLQPQTDAISMLES